MSGKTPWICKKYRKWKIHGKKKGKQELIEVEDPCFEATESLTSLTVRERFADEKIEPPKHPKPLPRTCSIGDHTKKDIGDAPKKEEEDPTKLDFRELCREGTANNFFPNAETISCFYNHDDTHNNIPEKPNTEKNEFRKRGYHIYFGGDPNGRPNAYPLTDGDIARYGMQPEWNFSFGHAEEDRTNCDEYASLNEMCESIQSILKDDSHRDPQYNEINPMTLNLKQKFARSNEVSKPPAFDISENKDHFDRYYSKALATNVLDSCSRDVIDNLLRTIQCVISSDISQALRSDKSSDSKRTKDEENLRDNEGNSMTNKSLVTSDEEPTDECENLICKSFGEIDTSFLDREKINLINNLLDTIQSILRSSERKYHQARNNSNQQRVVFPELRQANFRLPTLLEESESHEKAIAIEDFKSDRNPIHVESASFKEKTKGIDSEESNLDARHSDVSSNDLYVDPLEISTTSSSEHEVLSLGSSIENDVEWKESQQDNSQIETVIDNRELPQNIPLKQHNREISSKSGKYENECVSTLTGLEYIFSESFTNTMLNLMISLPLINETLERQVHVSDLCYAHTLQLAQMFLPATEEDYQDLTDDANEELRKMLSINYRECCDVDLGNKQATNFAKTPRKDMIGAKNSFIDSCDFLNALEHEEIIRKYPTDYVPNTSKFQSTETICSDIFNQDITNERSETLPVNRGISIYNSKFGSPPNSENIRALSDYFHENYICLSPANFVKDTDFNFSDGEQTDSAEVFENLTKSEAKGISEELDSSFIRSASEQNIWLRNENKYPLQSEDIDEIISAKYNESPEEKARREAEAKHIELLIGKPNRSGIPIRDLVKDLPKKNNRFVKKKEAAVPLKKKLPNRNTRTMFYIKYRSHSNISRGSASWAMMTSKGNTSWLKEAGIINDQFTAEHAEKTFKEAAGKKTAITEYDYKAYLAKLSRELKMPQKSLMEKMATFDVES